MPKKTPARMCIACRQMKEKHQLIRLAAFQGDVKVDYLGKAPGRGAYICVMEECLDLAIKKELLSRQLKVKLPKSFYAEIVDRFDEVIKEKYEQEEKESLQQIGMARRARHLICGTQVVEDAIRKGKVYLVLFASDLSEQTKGKLQRLASGKNIPYADIADKEKLGQYTSQAIRGVVGITHLEIAEQLKNKIQDIRETSEKSSMQGDGD